ncbi:MAG: hypothetical protein KBC48_00070 [Candidatus Pacebacteria bacterium]|nr:hypothetical protein [Candidatus Paceibacterota bacterium]
MSVVQIGTVIMAIGMGMAVGGGVFGFLTVYQAIKHGTLTKPEPMLRSMIALAFMAVGGSIALSGVILCITEVTKQ